MRFNKAVDEFSQPPAAPNYFHLEGDFGFPSIARYQFESLTSTTGGKKVAYPTELIDIDETHSFHVYGQANIPHLTRVKIMASFNDNGSPARDHEKPTMLGTGILAESGFEFKISVPSIIAKNSIELMWSVQHRATHSTDPEKAYIRIRFDLYNIKTDHKGDRLLMSEKCIFTTMTTEDDYRKRPPR